MTTWPLEIEGRRYYLGNGEIRVFGEDKRWYAAPTLVTHYVAVHNYAPPDVFRDAVLKAAHEMPSIDAETLAALAAKSPAARYDLCLDLLRSANTAMNASWAEVLEPLIAARRALEPGCWNEVQTELIAASNVTLRLADSPEPPGWLRDATKSMTQMLMSARVEDRVEKVSLDLAADAIESLLSGPAEVSATLGRLTTRCS